MSFAGRARRESAGQATASTMRISAPRRPVRCEASAILGFTVAGIARPVSIARMSRTKPARRMPRSGNIIWLPLKTRASVLAGRSQDLRPMLPQKLPQHRTVAPLLGLAVAPHREVGLAGERGEEGEEPAALGVLHLGAVAADELVPARVGDGLREQPSHQLRAGGEVRDPDVEEVQPGVVFLLHAPRRPPDRAEPEAFILD